MDINSDFVVPTLGKCSIDSPFNLGKLKGDQQFDFVADTERILFDDTLRNYESCIKDGIPPLTFEVAGPREKIYFDASKVKAAIVTCGGLCPGLNNVIRAIVMELHYRYGAKSIFGIKYGYQGFLPKNKFEPIMLTPDKVRDIHTQGGTILGSSRGGNDVQQIVDALERLNVNMLFTIGGDGTLHGAYEIHKEITERKLKISVIGIPKTIDNDVVFVDKTFGFETAFSLAVNAITSAQIEAEGGYNGIGLVKLMGRESGFIAANAALARSMVNFVLVPELDFDLEGPNGFLAHLEKRLKERHHAVVVIAEGIGQDWADKDLGDSKDASGNKKLFDCGTYLKDVIQKYMKERSIEHSIKYIDPSYMIRSAPAAPNDSIFCSQLGQNAVHAAMAGKTGIAIGRWHKTFTHIPISMIAGKRNKISLESPLWWNVLESTGQPMSMKN
ncbi:MAG: ATP-dependent 6-phosphofructokinase [Fibrobacteres bacterium]|nr:ATP-dependent 6-phosphofructokinase [Fibrobacterota bacterium]